MQNLKRSVLLKIVFLTCLLITCQFSLIYAADYLKGVEAYINGNYAIALAEWKPLAEQGDTRAQRNLAFMYSKGQGIIQDSVQAYAWYTISASQGSNAAMKSKEIVMNNMSSDQISRGEKLAKQFYSKIHNSK